MASRSKSHHPSKGKLTKRQLSPILSKKAAIPRVKRFQVRISFSRQLLISLRRFRTRKDRRSAQKKQLVFRTGLQSYREVAIVLSRRKQSKKPARRNLSSRPSPWAPSRALPPLLLIFIGVSGATFFGAHIKVPVKLDLIYSKSALAAPLPESPKAEQHKSMPRSDPTQIRIAKIGIDTSITPIGLTAAGELAPPNGFDVAGWYNQGPTPGEIGPAAIVGHVDSTTGIAVFWRLRELLPGDIVEVDRSDGTTARFKVTELKQFPQDQFPSQEVYGKIDYAGIRLITCGGTFNTQTGHYTHDTVVYGTLE